MADQGIFTDAHAERLKERAGQPYRPSNGTEGEIFMSRWCAHCRHDAGFQEDPEQHDSCPIIASVMAFDIGHPEYPSAWMYGADGQPRCAEWQGFGDEPLPRCSLDGDLFAPTTEAPKTQGGER